MPDTVRPNKTIFSEFGAEKGLLEGQARRMGGSCSEIPLSDGVLGETFLQAKFGVRAGGSVTFFWLVGGAEVTEILFQESCVQPEVTILHLGEAYCRSAKIVLYIYIP